MRSKDELMRSFRYNLIDAIAERGTNQMKLSKAIGASDNAVHMYCRGKAMPTLVPLVRMADALGVTVDDLVKQR